MTCYKSTPKINKNTPELLALSFQLVCPFWAVEGQFHTKPFKIQLHILFDSHRLGTDYALHGIRHTTVIRVQHFGY